MEAVKPLMTLLLNNSKALLSRNNTIEILNNGEATFGSIFKAIAKAKKYIHLEYYIIDKGELGEKLKELLITKARKAWKFVLSMMTWGRGNYPNVTSKR